MASINELMGVYPDNKKRRFTIGMFICILGGIAVLLVFLHSLRSYGTQLLAGNIINSRASHDNIVIILFFVYALLVSSVLYYIFLPWKKTQEY